MGKFLYPQCRMSGSFFRVWIYILDDRRPLFVPWMQMQIQERRRYSNCHFAHSQHQKQAPWIPAGCQWCMAGDVGILILNKYPLKLGGLWRLIC